MAQPVIKILKRQPSSEPCLTNLNFIKSTEPKFRPIKTLEEREAAYAEARQRILGVAHDDGEKNTQQEKSQDEIDTSCIDRPIASRENQLPTTTLQEQHVVQLPQASISIAQPAVKQSEITPETSKILADSITGQCGTTTEQQEAMRRSSVTRGQPETPIGLSDSIIGQHGTTTELQDTATRKSSVTKGKPDPTIPVATIQSFPNNSKTKDRKTKESAQLLPAFRPPGQTPGKDGKSNQHAPVHFSLGGQPGPERAAWQLNEQANASKQRSTHFPSGFYPPGHQIIPNSGLIGPALINDLGYGQPLYTHFGPPGPAGTNVRHAGHQGSSNGTNMGQRSWMNGGYSPWNNAFHPVDGAVRPSGVASNGYSYFPVGNELRDANQMALLYSISKSGGLLRN